MLMEDQTKIIPNEQNDKPIHCDNLGRSVKSNSQIQMADLNVIQTLIFKNQDGNLIIGLRKEYSILQNLETNMRIALEFKEKLSSIFKVDDFLVLFCLQGYIEVIQIKDFKKVRSFRHSSELDFSDVAETNLPNEFLVGFAHKQKNQYIKGMIASIILAISELQENKIIISYEEVLKSQTSINFQGYQNLPVICFARANNDLFVVCSIVDSFMLYDLASRKILYDRCIPNPSQSNNFNYLQPINIQSKQYPYLIYKDSRSIGYIDCTNLEAQMIEQCIFKTLGNHYSLYQETIGHGLMKLHTLYYNPEEKVNHQSFLRKLMEIEYQFPSK
ncbi:UNKNOWN [Stylonychia lemnae]|uniref:Uncharacterized protein n=1 Tax=Stylonychia lemnae TaxID=5949 RepID=A0A078AEA0_STYLE|nr:UNKNOWN [Stylonychia lemnae]|eukprot:CDW79248.1 UNKNOWN [Stylonychia lemnae]